MEPIETEIIQLDVQRPGTSRIGLEAKLIDLSDGTCRLAIGWPVGGEEINFDSWNFYDCLRKFRRVIEPEGYRVLCQGARPNAGQSGMTADSGGLLSYALDFGQPGLEKDLVRRFDPVDDIALVGTVAEQDEWIARHREAFGKRG